MIDQDFTIKAAGVDFIEENGGGAGVRLQRRNVVTSTIAKYEADIQRLSETGQSLTLAIRLHVYPEMVDGVKITKELVQSLPNPMNDYQAWYSEALSVVKQLLPERLQDFSSLYSPLKTRKELDGSTYTMSDFLRGISSSRGGQTVVDNKAAVSLMRQQASIVSGLKDRFKSKLFDIRTLVHADILDDELSASDELNRKGFHRGAGAIAGVVLEGHLKAVCERGAILQRKSAPTISDLNDTLKSADKIDVATWRFIQHLGDLRNKCDHRKESEPTKTEVNELIEGVRKITKTVL